jgi:hypothetical protein
MAVFPITPKPIVPVTIEPEWKTYVSEFDQGNELRRQGWQFPKYNVQVQYRSLTAANMQTLWGFYMDCNGAYSAFWFFDPIASLGVVTSHSGLYVCIGNASTKVFDLPGKSTSSRVLYSNGSVVSSGISYSTGTGDGGADRVTFATEPALGDVITCDFTGILRMRCRFAVDKLSRESFFSMLFNFGIQLKGLGPE